MVDNAIIVLGEYRHGDAVIGLIELFGAEYDSKQDWRYAYDPQMIRDQIADSLQKLTGKSFGENVPAWRKQWAGQEQNAFR